MKELWIERWLANQNGRCYKKKVFGFRFEDQFLKAMYIQDFRGKGQPCKPDLLFAEVEVKLDSKERQPFCSAL